MRKSILTILFFTSLVNFVTGQSWSPLGAGIGSGYYHSVNSFATYNGELYVGGYFNTAGNMPANNIAKWSGTNWSAVGNGINGDVNALCVFNGELYAGGSFSTAGGIGATGIARWNGTNWSQVGNIEAYIKAMVIYNGELYAGGWFSNLNSTGTSIAKWNGSSWTAAVPENDLYTVSIECMAVYNGDLYAAGAYYAIGGGGVAEFYRITKWNGSAWSNLLTIPASYTLDGALGDILSMTVYNNELYIAGTFGMMIDTIPTYQVAKWNGTNWSAVGTGINPEAYPFGGDSDGSAYSFVQSLAVYNGALYAGGHFDSCGAVATRNIARWDGTNWSALGQGVNGYVYSMIAADTSLYAGGWFNYVNSNLPANKIASWGNRIDTCLTTLSQPSVISGNNIVCSRTSQTYSINPVSGATSYIWDIPPGWTGSSTLNSITVTAGKAGGIISVAAYNNCGHSNSQTIMVSVDSVPAQPGNITGNLFVTTGQTDIYFIDKINTATHYSWSLNGGGNIITGQNTNAIDINWHTAGNYTLSVNAVNNCGVSTDQKINIKVAAGAGDDPYELKFLPNISTGDFYLTAKRIQDKLISVEVLNRAGQVICRCGKLQGTNNYSQLINLDKYSHGVYVVKIIVDNVIYTRKIVLVD